MLLLLTFTREMPTWNDSKYKSDIKELLKKHNFDFRRIIRKHKRTHTTFVEAFNKELAKQFYKPMGAQELQDAEKHIAIWVKYLNSIVNKLNSTKSSMIDTKPKDAIQLYILS